MLVRNAFENDFLAIGLKSKEWGDVVIEREAIYHILTTHFRSTCFVAEDRGAMIGYLLGFRSQTRPDQACLHMVQVDPKMRGHGIGRRLFNQFEATARAAGCKQVIATSRPENKAAMTYFAGMGLTQVQAGDMIEVGGLRAVKDYNGPGKHVVLWSKNI